MAAIPFLDAQEQLTYLDQVYEALRHRLLALPEGALEQPILAAGRERSAYGWIRMLLMGFAGHVGEMEALKAMQSRAKQR